MRRSLRDEGVASAYRSAIGDIWLKEAFRGILVTQQAAISLTPDCEVVVLNDSAVQIGYSSVEELIVAIQTVVQGDPRKRIGVAATAGTALVPSDTLAADRFSGVVGATPSEGVRVFGWRVRLTASQLNYSYRPIQIDVGPIVGAAGPVQDITAPVVSFAVIARRFPADLIVLSPSNGAGIFTIVRGGSSQVTDATSTSVSNGLAVRSIGDASTFCMIESLNQRDLTRRAVVPASSVGLTSRSMDGKWGGVYDEVFPGMRDEVFPGIRDAR